MKKMNKKGFTLVEIMIVVAIIGLLAAIGIPSIIGAYSTAQEKAKARNIAEVNKAKAVLTLPAGTITGAMDASESTSIAAGSAGETNLLAALKIQSLTDLSVGGTTINVGSTVGATTSY
ncbi:MAG: prepilin-type N-terminal cleavage/methylation domain-containing protein [Kiritimatiellales bacterium]